MPFLLPAAYLGGVLTIVSPCVLPVLPFVFARADRPFLRHGLPLLIGMALTFAGVSTLAVVGGAWIVELDRFGRGVALALLSAFGITLLFPSIADRITRRIVAAGAAVTAADPTPTSPIRAALSSAALGVGTGFLWAPCAGPILGLVLTGAALHGANVETGLLLLAYAAGAATSLAVALTAGGRVLGVLRRSLAAGEWLRRGAGAAVLVAVVAIATGFDTGILSRWSIATTTAVEQRLLDRFVGGSADRAGAPIRVATDEATTVPAAPLPVEGPFPSLAGAVEWINSAPLTPPSLRGKVVLVDFWTYSCINCLRTLPYVRAWAAKYADAGLVVIGVHTPEFAFEKRSANVHRATDDLRIRYPVAVDSDFAVWRAFGNRYWPAFYLIDAAGRVRYHQFGEGAYDRTERAIRQLLVEAGRPRVDDPFVAADGRGVEAAPDPRGPATEETYVGYAHGGDGLVGRDSVVRDRPHLYADAGPLRPNRWSLVGDWQVGREFATTTGPGARIAFRFVARDLHLVVGPSVAGRPVRFRVTLDGAPPRADHGSDVDADGFGVVDGQRLYQLVRQAGDTRERLFEIEFLDPGAAAYVFTFG